MFNKIFIDKETGEEYQFVKTSDLKCLQKKKVAIVVGHTKNSPGVYSSFIPGAEFDFWERMIFAINVDAICLVHDKSIKSYTERQEEMAEKTKDFDLVFELHFNSSKNDSAKGAEALYYHSNNLTRATADFFARSMESSMGIESRGAKALSNESQNGYGFVAKQKPDAIILEPFFGSNKSDCEKFNIDKFSEVLDKTIGFYFNNKENY